MVEFEFVRSESEYSEIIQNMLNEIDKMITDKEKGPAINRKIKEALDVAHTFEQIVEDGSKWYDVVREVKKFLEEKKIKCKKCRVKECCVISSKDGLECCEKCVDILHVDEDNYIVNMIGLAKNHPEEYFKIFGYVCYSCQNEIPKEQVKYCKQCRVVCYCSRKCQKHHWQRKNGHKKECKDAVKMYGENIDDDLLSKMRAVNQASLMTVYAYAIEKLRENKLLPPKEQ